MTNDTELRAAFYGRVSTEDNQDPERSRAWQLAKARGLIEAGGGRIVEEFFDVGVSRSLPWRRRPEAARLLEAVEAPGRGFSAIVIGEPHRAFSEHQYSDTMPFLQAHKVDLWVPDMSGPVEPDNEGHDLMMTLFGITAKGERTRLKRRVRAGMASQVEMGLTSWQGGRPPYGYDLESIGPHPNRKKAAEGKTSKRLVVVPERAVVVRRIFEMFESGEGHRSIAQRLTDERIPCPSASDPSRNRHRHGLAWGHTTIREILRNPVYTGYLVWNRTHKEETPLDLDNASYGRRTVQIRNGSDDHIWSPESTHEAIVDLATFERVQTHLAGRSSRKGQKP